MNILAADSHLDVAEILRKLQSVGFCSRLDVTDAGSETSSALFDRVLSGFLKEANRRGELRPLPAMVGDGRPVDMWKLYCSVRDMGGYDRVSAESGWASVAQAVGVESRCGPMVKLVFFKYLDAFERWVMLTSGKQVTGQQSGYQNLNHSNAKVTIEQSPMLSCSLEDQFLSPLKGCGCCSKTGANGNDNGDSLMLGSSSVKGGSNRHKRKQQTMVRFLRWVRDTAKNPIYCRVGKTQLADVGQGKNIAAMENYACALLARKALFQKVVNQTGSKANHQKEAKSGNCVKEKSSSTTCHRTFQLPDGNKTKDLVAANTACNDVQHTTHSMYFDNIADWLCDVERQKEVPVGSSFQSKVPDWTGRPSVSADSADELKWLGTQLWPPEGQENMPLFNDPAIGRGRPDTCECNFPGSVECTRFHIAEKRFQLNRELGPAFHFWGFRNMGEEVTLSWTADEQSKFKTIVHLNRPSNGKNFWKRLKVHLPHRKWTSLVSYYFNVFVLERRRYQNRVTCHNIDSDDDEVEFCFSNPMGQDRVSVNDSNSIVCALNEQCMDLPNMSFDAYQCVTSQEVEFLTDD
ncbi:AT-rich interactive domain-containing protein 2-like [Curcuma longa]|uniref:AT-rich interactive domain-containing protein 2-like n=1 Tax=Curcuma longa TaxID=136217 RepID=UPI003D9E46A9